MLAHAFRGSWPHLIYSKIGQITAPSYAHTLIPRTRDYITLHVYNVFGYDSADNFKKEKNFFKVIQVISV